MTLTEISELEASNDFGVGGHSVEVKFMSSVGGDRGECVARTCESVRACACRAS